jgi:hypothetical protein
MPVLSKLKNIELSEGWSYVTRSKGGRPSNGKRRAQPKPEEQNALTDESTVPRIIREVDNAVKNFAISNCAKTLITALPASQNNINVAVCAGLGTLDPNSKRDSRRSLHQLAVFIHLVEVISDGDCIIVASDPHFTSTDRTVLGHFKARVDSGSEPHFESTMERSMLYAPYLPWRVLTLDYLSISDARPTIIVCQDLRSVKEHLEIQQNQLADESIEVDGKKCCKDDLKDAVDICDKVTIDYDATVFPEYPPFPLAFQDLVVYIKKRVDNET